MSVPSSSRWAAGRGAVWVQASVMACLFGPRLTVGAQPESKICAGARRPTRKDLAFLLVGLQEGCEVEAGAGEEAAQQARAVLHPPQPGLDQRGELGEVAFGQVGQGSLEMGPDQLDRVQLVRVRRQLEDG